MYKIRIKQWGLDKKHKENEMRAIVRKNNELGSQGKSATFRVRGRPVDYKDVVSYFKRKKVPLEDIITQRTGSKTPEAVERFITVPSPITSPESMAIPERMLVSIRDYFRGSFENGTWVTTDTRVSCQTTKAQRFSGSVLNLFFEEVDTACELFSRNYFQEAGQSLIAATSRIRSIILAEDPDTLLFVFRITQRCLEEKRYEIALAILQQYSALAEIIMGKTHPIPGIYKWLAYIAASQSENVIIRCIGSIGDHFESLAGPLDVSTLSSRLIYIDSEVVTEHNMSQRKIWLKDLLHKCETTLEPFDIRIFEVRLYLAWYYANTADHAQAVRIGWNLVTYAQRLARPGDMAYCSAEGLYVVAISEYAMGDLYLAEIHLREVIEWRISNYGPNDHRARGFLVRLEGWLVEQGQSGSAAKVQERWKESLVNCTDYV